MKKEYLISIIGIIIFAVLVTIGVVIYKNTNSNLKKKSEEDDFEQINVIEENLIKSNIDMVATSSEEEKISPNCLFIFKTYYKKCEHTKVEKEIITETMVNKTRNDLEEIYKDWNIVTFRNNEVLFYKEEEKSCGEHYIIKELDGNIVIYTIDDNGNLNLYEKTEIVVNYLPEEDINKLKEGIRVNGKQGLNEALEDYE